MSEYSYQAEGNVDEFEGDVVVPEAVVDSAEWTQETYNDHDSGTVRVNAAEAALRLFEYDVIEPMLLDQSERDAEGEAKTVSLGTRITEAKERFGFKPTTHNELNRLRDLTTVHYALGAQTHLRRIQQVNVDNNRKAVRDTKDLPEGKRVKLDKSLPRRTAERIVGEYGSYVDRAYKQGALLLNLQSILSDRYKRSEPATSVSVLRDWSMDASTSEPIKALMKAAAIEAYAVDDTDKQSPLQIDFSKLDRAVVREMGDDFLKTLKVGQLQDRIAALVEEQRKRFAFWTNVLKEALPNADANESASAVLEKYKLL